MKKRKILIGAHLSGEGGLEKAFERAAEIGCTTFQIFTKSNRQWASKALTDEAISLFKKAQKRTAIYPIVAHASYLINLGSENEETREKSLAALIDELNRCYLLDIPFLVVHPGSCGKQPREEGLEYVVKACNKALEKSEGKALIVLETMAGQGSSLASTTEELAYLIKNIKNKDRIGVCIDTCHIFSAGYDLGTEERYYAYMDTFNNLIGLNYIKVIHINNSKNELGSRVDRHEHIDQGHIKEVFFKLLMNDEKLDKVPKILETPKDSPGAELRNVTFLENLISPML